MKVGVFNHLFWFDTQKNCLNETVLLSTHSAQKNGRIKTLLNRTISLRPLFWIHTAYMFVRWGKKNIWITHSYLEAFTDVFTH